MVVSVYVGMDGWLGGDSGQGDVMLNGDEKLRLGEGGRGRALSLLSRWGVPM
jgi:hypothetical protein